MTEISFHKKINGKVFVVDFEGTKAQCVKYAKEKADLYFTRVVAIPPTLTGILYAKASHAVYISPKKRHDASPSFKGDPAWTVISVGKRK